ncbi:thiolase family protein [Neobacillus niacini]|uniref:thiolase family protein n=1 Tax=Neobacillus niacini TaxID=86668 RepID=UPI0021CAE58E|nr:thiolase family protein [Neobacillus niacini]MCM3766265.1 thiolase family protein [Neobacillus niacini]
MEKVYIIGISMTKFGKLFSYSYKDLTRLAVEEALGDAGITKELIDVIYFSNVGQGLINGQHSVRGQVALRPLGFEEIPVINVENACASASTALNQAINFLKAGEGEFALAVGVEKMYKSPQEKDFEIFNTAWDVETPKENMETLMQLGEGYQVPESFTKAKRYSMFMDVYASFARFHMKTFGTTQHQIAAVAAKNHQNSVHNPLSQYQKPFTIEEVLNAAPIVYPFTLPMCSPVSDGAAAAIVCTESGLKRLAFNRDRSVEVLTSVIQTGSTRKPEEVEKHLTAIAAKKAYEKAGVGPEDISVAEVHDATAIGEIIQVENLGFCHFGEGGFRSEKGEFSLSGRLPVNPSGGLESKGHPIGATGLAQIYELVVQLRGEAGQRQIAKPTIALAENGGGVYGIEEAVASITILKNNK